MQAQLNRIEKELKRLAIAVEHRLTDVETTQRNLKWFMGIALVLGTVLLKLT